MRGFLSYTLRDGLVTLRFLGQIKELLEDSVCELYVDRINGKSELVQAEIIERIQQSDVLYLWQSPAVTYSPWVRLELQQALLFRVPILPVNRRRN